MVNFLFLLRPLSLLLHCHPLIVEVFQPLQHRIYVGLVAFHPDQVGLTLRPLKIVGLLKAQTIH